VSLLNPILYMINAFRYGILGVSDIDVRVAFAIILLFIVALFGYSLWLPAAGTASAPDPARCRNATITAVRVACIRDRIVYL